MRARFIKAAELEVDETVAYFDEQRDGLGDRFKQDLQNTVAFITSHPFSGKAISARVRKFSLHTFRYNIVYIIDADEIVVVAVAHHRRRPAYWRSRLAPLR